MAHLNMQYSAAAALLTMSLGGGQKAAHLAEREAEKAFNKKLDELPEDKSSIKLKEPVAVQQIHTPNKKCMNGEINESSPTISSKTPKTHRGRIENAYRRVRLTDIFKKFEAEENDDEDDDDF